MNQNKFKPISRSTILKPYIKIFYGDNYYGWSNCSCTLGEWEKEYSVDAEILWIEDKHYIYKKITADWWRKRKED